jgi:hypothetical protein
MPHMTKPEPALSYEQLKLEHARLLAQVYCEYNGVPTEIVGCTDEALIEWANSDEIRERMKGYLEE